MVRSLGQRGGIGVPVACVCLLACGGAEAHPTAPTVTASIAPRAMAAMLDVRVGPLPEGVTAETGACAAHTEACDGRDDDCDGQIDEGCGYDGGAVQITLAWEGGADLDLYVTDPTGFTISYLDRASTSGGALDHDARGACNPSGPPVENVRWGASAPPGEYRVDVHYWGDCGVAGSTPAHVTIAVAGRVVGTYDLTLELAQRRVAVTFAIGS
jgi:hypothetical protein